MLRSDRLEFALLTGRSLLWEATRVRRRHDLLRARLAEPAARVAVFHQGGIGSGLMLGPLLQVIRTRWPRASVDLLSQQVEDAEVLRSVGLIDNHHVVREERPAGGPAYDVLLSAARTVHGGRLVRAIPAAVKIGFRHRVGWHDRSALFHDMAVVPDVRRHECEQDVSLLGPVLGETDLPVTPPSLFDNSLSRRTHFRGRPRVFVHPGSSSGMSWKRWAPENFARLIEELHQRLDAEVTLVSGPAEAECAAEILRLLPTGLAGEYAPQSIVSLFEELRTVDCAVSNDGAFMHLACAARTKVVAIFGGTDPGFCGPWGDPALIRVVRADIECSPCYKPYSGVLRCTNASYLQCLTEISPAWVVGAVCDLLGEDVAA